MLLRQIGLAALVVIAGSFCFAEEKDEAKPAEPASAMKHHDGSAEVKRSLGGSGEMLHFTLPQKTKIAGVKIHGSRYGYPQAPKEDFLIYVLDADGSEVLSTKKAPYSKFQRGEQKWVTVRFPQPIEVPDDFWICLDFRATQTKGVYVSYDDSTGGKHSRTGLPGQESSDVTFGGDWMIELIPAESAE